MTIFSRITDIVHSNINSLLDKAEEPEKMVRLMIQEMEDTLVEVRTAAVRAIADKKEIGRRLEKLEASAGEWQGKAEFALSKQREDLAKAALVAKRKLEDQADVLRAELTAIEESLAKYNDDLAQLQNKLAEAKAKKKALEIRMTAANKRVAMRRTLHDGRIDDAMARYETLERRIDELEADAESYDLGKERTLDDEFTDLAAESEVEDELREMKAKLAKQRNQG
ncbi:MAG: phage shock protein PspA [Alphaproteobacteria bacterium]|jgi:phage shock protein A|nr:phage shock protein PspA [Alphaproteobacteria bacterium]MDP6563813.1 phage shock protein PspA [Alphaproteobacteria bacterium]MDP6811750.1 phage shock protein PspA [Alphaproteobacteria bacterium]